MHVSLYLLHHVREREYSIETEMEMESSSSYEVIPTDLILEIVARSISDDPATIIRCAATSKPLRRAILHPHFLRRLRILIHDNDHHRSSFFIPSLFLGLFHQVQPARSPLVFVPAAELLTLPDLPHDDDAADQINRSSACVLGSYKPVASRRSLLVLRRRCTKDADCLLGQHRHGERAVELSVCNPVATAGGPSSAGRWVLPPAAVHDQTHALLDVDITLQQAEAAASPSFKLLVAHLRENSPEMVVQVFSSEDRAWGPPMACGVPRRCRLADVQSPKPVVRRGAVHWLCRTDTTYEILKWRHRRGKEPEASLLSPPPCVYEASTMCLALWPSSSAPDMDKTAPLLSVVALLEGRIDVWVRTGRSKEGSPSSSSWSRHRVIVEEEIARPVGFPGGWLGLALVAGFCDGSGTVLLDQMEHIGSPPWLLNLESNSISESHTPTNRWMEFYPYDFVPYEVDLLSYMLYVMKHF